MESRLRVQWERLANMVGSRVARGLAAKVGSRLGLTLKREKLASLMIGSRVARGLAGKVVISNAISRITLTKGAVVVSIKRDELSRT